MTNATQSLECESRDRPEAWTAPQIEAAVVSALTSRFSDWRMTEIEISEQEARSIAIDIVRLLDGLC